jgi:GxxExxY protein
MSHKFENLSADAIGAALAVHRSLGPGFLESTYPEARRVSLTHRGLPFESQVKFDIGFEGVPVGCARLDLIVENQIVVELKAVERLRDVHYAQLKSYVRAASLHIGLLFNFNAPTLTIRRMVLD